jgi:membrane-bound ClpP family serine protease
VNDSMLIWGWGLIGLGLILVALDLFLPTAGLLALLAGLSALGGVVCLFFADLSWGITGLGLVLVGGPLIAAFMLKIWPNTPIGRRLIAAPSDEEVEAQRANEESERQQRQALIGKEGTVLTDLRPIGVVEINGTRYDALSETRFVQAGSAVRVTAVDGMQVKVRPVVPTA